jgi:hypothetical protein
MIHATIGKSTKETLFQRTKSLFKVMALN